MYTQFAGQTGPVLCHSIPRALVCPGHILFNISFWHNPYRAQFQYIWIAMFLANLIWKRHISLQVNSLWPNDAIWWHRTCSTLAQVMACCLTVPSHYLNQCWRIISKVQWHSSGSHFTRDTLDINHWNQFENYLSKLLFNSPSGQWVKPSANISFIWWT